MNKLSRLTALLLALMMLLSTFAAAETSYPAGGMTAEQWQQLVEKAEDEVYVINAGDSGKTVDPPVATKPVEGPYAPYADGTETELSVAEGTVEALRTESGVALLKCTQAGQWQILMGDVWADLSGETGDALWVSPAMMSGMSQASFRKALLPQDEKGEYSAYTQTAQVSVTSAQPQKLSMSARADQETAAADNVASTDVFSLQRANEKLEKYLITIEYRFKSNNNVAATSYYAEVSTTTTAFSAEVKHPIIMGYKPAAAYEGTLPADFTYSETQMTISSAQITDNVTLVVYYEPAEVKYTINYWEELTEEKLDPVTGLMVKYTKVKTVEDTGLTESTVRASSPDTTTEQYWATQHNPAGFQVLLYDDTVKLAADGSTVVDIYYQRKYYLMVFNLGGGYGVNPVYAKYGTDVGEVKDPTRAGYDFKGWTLDKDKTVYTADYAESNFTTIPATVQLGNETYYAVWEAVEVDYSVTYWLENPNWDGVSEDDHYLYWGSVPKRALTETMVNASDYWSYTEIDGKLNQYEKRYSTYNKEKTEAGDGVKVAGDGSTVLNVYYDRNEYTLRFYYAMSTTSDKDVTTYYVVGGSTYYFGTYNTSNTDDPVKRIDPYMGQGSYKAERGKVDAEPTLNEKGLSRNYEKGSESSVVGGVEYDYHYIQFKAKYGQNISTMWPADVFNSVPYTGNKGNGWGGDQAFVSAWNGEYNVYYSHHAPGGNQTIKGNYAELDYQLLWDQACGTWGHPNKDNKLVSYLCFWENGANRSWNVPELYRYNVYVPVFEGDDLSDPTNRVYNGVTYKLRERYNTVDNSTVDEQTKPAINGLSCVNREGVRITDYDKTLYNEAWDVFFYYSRNSYDIAFSNYGNGTETKTHMFEEDISQYETYVPKNPPAYPAGSYVFAGWYTSPELQPEAKYTFTTMPSNDVILYAKWEPVTHNVKVYWTQEEADAGGKPKWEFAEVRHNMSTSSSYTFDNPNHFDPDSTGFEEPKREGMTFTYWFYYDENGDAQAFSFNTTPITRDTVVYAGWTASELATYTIYYVKDDGNPNTVNINQDNWVAAPVNGSGLAGATTTEHAKGGTELYSDFQKEYFPTVESHSFTLDVDAGKNVYVFEYVKAAAVPYKVLYVTEEKPDAGMSKGTVTIDGKTYYMLADTKEVKDNTKAVVTENYAQIGGSYVPDAFQKRLILKVGTSMEENVIVFYYTKDVTSTTLEVNHILVHADGSKTIHDSVKQIINSLPQGITVETITVANYPYDATRSERFDGTSTRNTFGGLTFTLQYGAEGVVINLYYVEETVDIQYIPVGPEGYDANGAPNATAAGSVDPTAQTVGVVTGQPGSTATANENYTFVGWYKDATCTQLATRDAAYAPAKVDGVHVAATYYAKFEEKKATINYVAVGGGTVDPASETLLVLTGTADGSTATADEDYNFVGWYKDAECQQPVDASWVQNGKITPQKPGDVWPETTTYYAKFEEKKATIKYAVGPAYAGMGTVSPEGETLLVLTGIAAGSEAAPTDKTTFEGWYLDEACTQPVTEAWVAGTKITPAKDATAAWVDGTTYYAKFAYKPGQLDITKTVVNNTGKPLKDTAFTFTVTLTDENDRPLKGAYTCVIGDTSTTVVPDAEGKLILTLAVGAMNGQIMGETRTVSASILNLPHGTQYAVTEAHVDDCLITFEGANGQIEATETSTAAFTNTFPAPTTSTLTVIKAGMQPGESAIIRVDVDGKTYYLSLSGTHSQDTITGLPIGSSYTVAELNTWTWQYEDTSAVTGEILRDGASRVTITNKSTTDKWLHDESSVINDLGAGSKTNINNQ